MPQHFSGLDISQVASSGRAGTFVYLELNLDTGIAAILGLPTDLLIYELVPYIHSAIEYQGIRFPTDRLIFDEVSYLKQTEASPSADPETVTVHVPQREIMRVPSGQDNVFRFEDLPTEIRATVIDYVIGQGHFVCDDICQALPRYLARQADCGLSLLLASRALRKEYQERFSLLARASTRVIRYDRKSTSTTRQVTQVVPDGNRRCNEPRKRNSSRVVLLYELDVTSQDQLDFTGDL
ncbi:hypothetical protein C1H76_3037 [Elsinoe australis]|uniref:Uncharacterized protein n=1 Tax=Elsinoe australis TaxID=40998 RepID=A0A4U7B4Q2_9PEZI|nr:hypothetical protein C1H76_3037 [Elsinoe australis]